MAYSDRISWETMRTVDSSTLTGVYVNMGTPLQHPSYKCKMVNLSNVTVTVSIDGTNDIDVCPTNGFWLYDESIGGRDGAFPALPQGTQIMIKGAAGTGLIYLVSQYLINV